MITILLLNININSLFYIILSLALFLEYSILLILCKQLFPHIIITKIFKLILDY
jgi:hypothetical protein